MNTNRVLSLVSLICLADQMISQPGNANFAISSTKPTYHPDEGSNPGTCLLTVSLPLGVSDTTRIVILLTPASESPGELTAVDFDIIPFSSWAGQFNQE